MAAHTIIECLDCGYSTPFFATSVFCPRCGSFWREALYDYQSIALSLPLQLPGRPFDIWRYRELLPVRDPNPEISLGSGGSPLIHAYNLGAMIGCQNLFIKDERQGPTRSFKSRQAAVTIGSILEAGVNEMVVGSTGNLALAYAAIAARTGIHLWVFLSSRVSIPKIREIQLYGARTVKVCGSFDQVREVAREFARQRNLFLDQAAQTIPSIEAMKTISFETAEQLTAMMGPPLPKDHKDLVAYRAPDWFIEPVSLGTGPLGVLKGFSELHLMKLINRSPAMALFQPEGCSPMVRAWKQGLDLADPISDSRTMIETLTASDPGRVYSLLLEKMDQETGGLFDSVTDAETIQAQRLLAHTEGIFCEQASAVAFAGLLKLAQAGSFKENDVIVTACTGQTSQDEIGARNHHLAMGSLEGEILDTDLEDGLISALMSIHPSGFQKVIISQPDPSFSQFLHLALSLQGHFNLIDAPYTPDLVSIIQQEKPDLVIIGLGGPEMTGFTIIDKLGTLPEMQDILVILTLADRLTDEEKRHLDQYLEFRLRSDVMVDKMMIDEIQKLV